MIRISNKAAKAMEFTSFRKKDQVSDDEILLAALAFEKAIAAQEGLIFHCLVRNEAHEYANVLFSESMESLKSLGNNFGHLEAVNNFFQLIDNASVKIEYHEIKKENFLIPTDFSCIEKGTFALNPPHDLQTLQSISQAIAHNYLDTFDNTKAYGIGQLESNLFSEITIGKTLAQTKQICMGYLENPYGLQLMNIADKNSMNLGFWYVIA